MTTININSQQFQEFHGQIQDLGDRLSQYINELQSVSDASTANQEVLAQQKEQLETTIKQLKEQKYQVAVIAAMKAGKSTFLNALIGDDILASESESCTVCRTEIKPLNNGELARLEEYRRGEDKPILLAEGDSNLIRQTFLNRTREIRQNNNENETESFAILHSIEAIKDYTFLNGFTLIDTPGPNEWESAHFDTAKLKKSTLEALRTCNVILFILDYSSFKDNTNQELLNLIKERGEEILEKEGDKIFFILNKIDRRTEKDRPIEEIINDLKTQLTGFGINEPKIYPSSAWKGLLSKLILQDTINESQKKDFRKFFAASYAVEDEEEGSYIPGNKKIAPQALIDSGIPALEEEVIKTIIKDSGWIFLADILTKIENNIKAIDNSLTESLASWKQPLEHLEYTVKKMQKDCLQLRIKIDKVDEGIKNQKQILINGFSRELDVFADNAKSAIQKEIDRIAEERARISNRTYTKEQKSQPDNPLSTFVQDGLNAVVDNPLSTFVQDGLNAVEPLLDLVPGGKLIKTTGKLIETGGKFMKTVGSKLIETLFEFTNNQLNQLIDFDSDPEIEKSNDPYIIRIRNKNDANNIEQIIDQGCMSQMKNWWQDSQDSLIRGGNKIREKLTQEIQTEIQSIADEFQEYLEVSLDVKLQNTSIQFPTFEFQGIDARLKEQQKIIQKTERKKRKTKGGWCDEDRTYYEDVPITQRLTYFEVDLRQIIDQIYQQIDEQLIDNKKLLERIINKQINEDFKVARKQLEDVMQSSQNTLEKTYQERQKKQEQANIIIPELQKQQKEFKLYLSQVNKLQESLDISKN